jgi:hypothetical protein
MSHQNQSVPALCCSFKQCAKVKGDGPYCPRHEFLVAQFGLDKAIDMECGYACPQCKAVTEVQCEKCQGCELVGCEACRQANKCCLKRLEEIESEASDLEEEAEDLRRDARNIEDKIAAKKERAA